MNKQEREQVVRFTTTAAKAGFSQAQILRMLAIAKAQTRLNEQHYYGFTDRQQARADKLDNEMREICASVGLTVYCNGDPRGAPFIINETENGERANKSLPNFRVPSL